MANKFIVVEGMDGSGKTTLVQKLSDELIRKNQPCLTFRQPGGTPLAETLRTVLKENLVRLSPAEKHFLLETSRISLLEQIKEIIKNDPSTWIISDRHVDSTYAYQGWEGVNPEYIDFVHRVYEHLPQPSLTIFLDVSSETSASRIKSRGGPTDKFDSLTQEDFVKIKDLYKTRIQRNPGKYLVVDANGPLESYLNTILHQIEVLNVDRN